MKTLRAPLTTIFAAAVVAAAVMGNFAVAESDGAVSANIEDYSIERLVFALDMQESAVQTAYTYFDRDAVIINPGTGGLILPELERFEMYFGDSLGNQALIDLRDSLPADEIELLELKLDAEAFQSFVSCPHEVSLSCLFSVSWDRAANTKNPELRLLFVRLSESHYALLDTAFFDIDQGVGN